MSIKQEFLTTSSSQTEGLGFKLAQDIGTVPVRRIGTVPMRGQSQAIIIGLEGDLGGGKTTFLKGFARGLGLKQKILSPTFIILKKFKIPNTFHSIPFTYFYHIDCYRIKKPKEILKLGFKKIISNPKNIVCIEWADKIKKILPRGTLILRFKFISKNKRRITIENY